MSQGLKNIDRIIGKAEDGVAISALGVVMLIVVVQVFFRYVLATGILWANELIADLMVLTVMFGAPAATRRYSHTALEMVVERIPGTARKVVRAISFLIGFIFLSLFLYSSIEYVISGSGMLSLVLKIPMPIVYSIMVIGAILMVYEYARTVRTVVNKRD